MISSVGSQIQAYSTTKIASTQNNQKTNETSPTYKDTINISDAAKTMAANETLNNESSTSSSSDIVFSTYAEKKMNARGVSGEQQELFGDIIQRAEDQINTPTEAKNFISSLSSEELATLQKVHGLADEINPQELDMEGAYNLIQQPGDVEDFNDDGFVNIGKATTFVFPPPNAPQNVKDAWEETTANMSDGEKLRATMPFLPLPDIRQEGNSYVVVDHDDPDYNNPYEMGSSYQDIVGKLLEGNEASKSLNSREVYEEWKELLEIFSTALEKHNCL